MIEILLFYLQGHTPVNTCDPKPAIRETDIKTLKCREIEVARKEDDC